MPFLEVLLQQRVALQRICQTPGSQKKLNLFKCEWSWAMIVKDLKVFSQNVQKNNFLINTILKVNYNFDIIFIQEPSWMTLRTILLWNALDTNIFLFLLSIFLDFIFLFLFLFSDDEEARDIAVTWHITWCDVIDLECSRKIWKMTSGHMYTTWWPWVRNEADMRM